MRVVFLFGQPVFQASSCLLERLESGQSWNMLLRERHVQGQVFKIVFVYSVDGFISAK